MLDTMRAEWQKTRQNRWATGLAIWVFPAGALGMFTFILLIVILGVDAGRMQLSDVRWTDQMIMAWQVATGNIFGYLLLSAFAATIFAGESAWNTWKNLVPRRSRSRLILAKFAVAAVFVLIAFGLTSLIAGVASLILAAVMGVPVVPALDGESIRAFVALYVRVVPVSFLALMMTLAYATIASVLTRSLVFGVIGGAGIATLEFGSGALLSLLNNFTQASGVLRIQQIMPSYNLANLRALAVDGVALPITAVDGTSFVNSGAASLLVVGLWLVGLLGITILIFNRRDID